MAIVHRKLRLKFCVFSVLVHDGKRKARDIAFIGHTDNQFTAVELEHFNDLIMLLESKSKLW